MPVTAPTGTTNWGDPSTWKVIVSGGSSGLGAAVCSELTDTGAEVVSLDRRRSKETKTVEVDLADARAAEQATRSAIDILGRVDAVICCAGVDVPGTLATVDPAAWDRVVAVNLNGTAAVIRAALPELTECHGRAVTVASTLAHRAVSDATAYCASKFGLIGFTRALTAELRGTVGVTMVTPGGMRTAFFDDRDEQYRPGPDAVLADPAAVARSIVWSLERPEDIEVRELVVMAPLESSWP